MDDFPLFAHAYLQRAALAGLFAGVGCALAGCFVVTMQLSFLGVCIAHAAFAGALAALWAGLDPLWGALLFALLSAAVVGPMADRGELSPDASIGVVFMFMLGLGFLFLGLIPGARTQALSLLWGSILTLDWSDVTAAGAACLLVVGVVVVLFKPIRAVVCHREVAAAVGIPATAVFYGLLLLTGATVAASLRTVGGLLVYSLMLGPAAAAYQLTYSFRLMMVLACIFGAGSCWAGLAASYWWDLPAGASIVLCASAIFGACLAASPKRRTLSDDRQRV
jgi:manganese/iron transport system permease protein